MNANEVKQAFDKFSQASRTIGSANSRSRMFADRARQAVCEAYERDWQTGEWSQRKNVSAEVLEKANKLIGMGFEEAVYGRGRALLR